MMKGFSLVKLQRTCLGVSSLSYLEINFTSKIRVGMGRLCGLYFTKMRVQNDIKQN